MTSRLRGIVMLMLAGALVGAPVTALAQTSPPTAPATPPQAPADPVDDTMTVLSEPDFTLGALPTTLRLPKGKFAFRIAHRFSRAIAGEGIGGFFSDFFGFDSAALIGFELRAGLWPGTQLAVIRTNAKVIQFLGQAQLVGQTDTRPVSIDLLLAAEGRDNFREKFSQTVGLAVSRRLGDRGAIYVEPMMVLHSNAFARPSNPAVSFTSDNTVMVGLGGRLRLGQSRTYVVGEYAPVLSGYKPAVDIDHISFGLERRAGGHSFQITVSNAFGLTLNHVARGGDRKDSWFIGFNISRKFF